MKLIILALVLLLTTSTAFSQKTVLDKNGDTLICLTINKIHFLQKKYYEVQKWKTKDSICTVQLTKYDSIITSNEIVYKKQMLVIRNKNEIIDLKDYQISKLEEQIIIEHQNTRTQKIYKWVAIITGGAVSSFLGFKLLTN